MRMKYKKLIPFVLAAAIPISAFAADNLQVTQGSGTTVAADEVTRNSISEKQQVVKIGLGAEGLHDGFARMGKQSMANSMACVLPSEYAEDAAHVTGDPGTFILGVANPSRATLAADGDYTPLATTVHGAAMVSLDATAVTSAGNQPVRLEDAPFAASDATMMLGGVNNGSGATVFNTTNGDVTPIAVNRYGGVMCDLNIGVQGDSSGGTGNSLSPIRREDDSFGDLNTTMVIGARYIGNNAFGASAGTANDITTFDVDIDNRLAVNAFGANTTNWFFSCGTATATTSNVSIKGAAGSGVRNYITSISCSSSDADNATDLAFKDGTNQAAAGGISQMAAGAPGSFTMAFPLPIRGSTNTAFNFATNVSTSSVTCCVQGFNSNN